MILINLLGLIIIIEKIVIKRIVGLLVIISRSNNRNRS